MHSISDDIQRERRMAPRARLETRATVHLANEELVCRTRDLSADGLALVVDEGPVPTGTFMRIRMELPDAREILDLDGILVRTDPHSTGLVWGLQFFDCETDAQAKIERYITTHSRRKRSDTTHSASGEGFMSVGGDSSSVIGLSPVPSAAPRKIEDS